MMYIQLFVILSEHICAFLKKSHAIYEKYANQSCVSLHMHFRMENYIENA